MWHMNGMLLASTLRISIFFSRQKIPSGSKKSKSAKSPIRQSPITSPWPIALNKFMPHVRDVVLTFCKWLVNRTIWKIVMRPWSLPRQRRSTSGCGGLGRAQGRRIASTRSRNAQVQHLIFSDFFSCEKSTFYINLLIIVFIFPGVFLLSK